MNLPVNPKEREELLELYSELHLACGRASATLRLSAHYDVPDEDLLKRFQLEEDRAARLWTRIVELTGNVAR